MCLSKIGKNEDEPVMSLNEVVKKDRRLAPLNFEEINEPEQYADRIKKFLTRNSDIFAEKDSQLGHTNTVKMKINTEDHPPIKLRPYRAPLNNRMVIDEAGTKRPLRRAAFVVPPTDSSSDSSDDSSLEESPHKKLAKR